MVDVIPNINVLGARVAGYGLFESGQLADESGSENSFCVQQIESWKSVDCVFTYLVSSVRNYTVSH